MIFSELSIQDKEYLFKVYTQAGISHEEKMGILSKKFGVVPRTIRRWAAQLGVNAKEPLKMSKQIVEAMDRYLDDDVDILLITSAQNKTIVNTSFLSTIEIYKGFLESMGKKVSIVVIPLKYRNPTTLNESSNDIDEDWWDTHIEKYMYFNKIYFNDVLISADSRIVPTAKMPLEGFESLASSNNLVLGHPRIHYKVLPRFKHQNIRTMNTTGSCTLKQYSKSKAGDVAFIHHSYGFTIIEKKEDGVCYKPRCVKANSDGSFTDLIYYVDKNGVKTVKSSKGMIIGDIHHAQVDDDKMRETKEIIQQINPKDIILHDVFDGYSLNPHVEKDFFFKKKRIKDGAYLVRNEVDNTISFIDSFKNMLPVSSNLILVQSNHDDFIDRWINNYDWKKDLHNSETYLEYAAIQQNADLTKYGNIFGYLVSEHGIKYITNSESYFIGEYQVGHHGDNGINGAKGSTESFKRLNQKMVHGHSHSPKIIDGVTCVGVSCKIWQYYNSKGLSSWCHADAIIHDSGKVQLIVYDDDYKISGLI